MFSKRKRLFCLILTYSYDFSTVNSQFFSKKMRFFRLFKIIRTASVFGLDEMLSHYVPFLKWCATLQCWRNFNQPRAVRLRLALESLGPIFVKFGQVLSTRPDLIPSDIAQELAKLQDQVPPFDGEIAKSIIENNYGKKIDEVFCEFNLKPIASASIAQVHFARLKHNPKQMVAVKILRPNMQKTIANDLALLDLFAYLLEKLWNDGKRLKPREVVAEFAKFLHNELDLMKEAANCAQLRRNFLNSNILSVPEVYFDLCTSNIMVMQAMHGTPISKIHLLKEKNIHLKQLAENGVEIFFTQVFRDGFFHADMHPGNILVDDNGKYIALDFGIVATLTDLDKNYLAQNFLAFFKRDYKRVAQIHVECGWAPANTRIDEFEQAIRAVCEPIFNRPLKDISFGKVLLRLFQTSRRFNVSIQPQLVMLQKTLLNIEGLGRELYPNLDLWQTAQPFLENWMKKQVGFPAFKNRLKEELPNYANILPQLPRLIHQYLSSQNNAFLPILKQIEQEKKTQNKLLFFILVVFILLFFKIYF